jgi:hypothetical protein
MRKPHRKLCSFHHGRGHHEITKADRTLPSIVRGAIPRAQFDRRLSRSWRMHICGQTVYRLGLGITIATPFHFERSIPLGGRSSKATAPRFAGLS